VKKGDSMEHRVLTSALVELLVFLEFASDRDVNPDAAVVAMESVSATLRKLGDEERRNFVDRLREIASDYPVGEHRDFILNLGESIGLTD
jgi:hypothetical protein